MEGKIFTKIWSKNPIKIPIVEKNLGQVPRSEPRSSKKKTGARHSPKYRDPTEQREKRKKDPIKRCPGATFDKMGEETQAGHTPTP